MVIVFIASVALLQVLVIFVHLAVYGAMAAAFGIGGPWTEALAIVLAFTFTSASLLAVKWKSRILSWYYTASAYWFGLVHFLFVGVVAFLLALDFANIFNYAVSLPLLGAICITPFFFLHLYGTWASGRAKVTRIVIRLGDGPGAVPAFWRNHTLVFVSDMHLGNIRGKKFAKKVTDTINALEPAAVFIGGDLYDGPKCDEAAIIEPLKKLQPSRGTYFVTGNHEYYGSTPHFLEAIQNVGIRILGNEKVDIEGIDVIGLDYRATHAKEGLSKVLADLRIDRDKATILIMHEPAHRDELARSGIAIGFFGHTHRGQIFPLSLITRRMYRGFDYGLKRLGAMQFYISSGVGTWGPPLRLGTTSEIVQVTFA